MRTFLRWRALWMELQSLFKAGLCLFDAQHSNKSRCRDSRHSVNLACQFCFLNSRKSPRQAAAITRERVAFLFSISDYAHSRTVSNSVRISIFHFPISTFEFDSLSLIAARRIRRSAHMQMAQIMQRLPVLIIQSPREVWIVQSLIARPFRHVLQYTKLLLDHLLALPRNLSPSRQHLILHIVALFRRH